jgi:hypothetical protein
MGTLPLTMHNRMQCRSPLRFFMFMFRPPGRITSALNGCATAAVTWYLPLRLMVVEDPLLV